ncbi:MAG: ATP-binding cassette domain-containing protein [Pseudomonadota bacterium]|nr:ATP-binding cassette domain-containing protein [Pseudomonadota bacterium]
MTFALQCRGLRPGIDPPLAAVDLDVPAGSVVVIAARSGAYRGHLLQALAGLSPVRCQMHVISGVDLLAPDRRRGGRRPAGSGFISHAYPLLSNLNACANVMLPLMYHRKLPRREAMEAAHDLLDAVEFQADRTALPAFLDADARWRALLARALGNRPPLLFLDEPFELDNVEHWTAIGALLLSLARQFGCTLIIETANLAFAREHASQTIYADAQASLVLSAEQAFAHSDTHTSWTAYLNRLGTYPSPV